MESLQENLVWDPNTQRSRRKVVFTEEDDDSDARGTTDDEDGETEDSDQEEQGYGDDDDCLSTLLNNARAKSEIATEGVPAAKRQKLEEGKDRMTEMPAFADSEDELELSEGEAGRAGDSGHCSEEEEEEDSDESKDVELHDTAEASVKKQAMIEDEEEDAEQGKCCVLVPLHSVLCSCCTDSVPSHNLIWFSVIQKPRDPQLKTHH